MADDRFYLTTPIYYPSGDPHIGHAYTTLLADTLARYQRQAGRDVLFLTGTDEHGQKMQEAAAERDMDPQALCDEMAVRFQHAWAELGVSHDRFIRTTEAEHKGLVTAVLQRLWDTGHIYKGDYVGWYSVSQERFFTEKEVGPDKVDPIAGKPLERVEEVNYFFRMSAFQDRLIQHIESNPDWIVPASRRNEVLGFLSKPLGDLSISRPKSRIHWGIPLPFDPEHVSYVWVDALFNYVTASGILTKDEGTEFGDAQFSGFGSDGEGTWWPADLHLVGKDIITTHAVYWPTLLMAVDLPLPRQILAHGWWVTDDRKMSKSLGNVVDPLQLREAFSTDAVRWYLMREMPTGADANYTDERFLTRYEELANVLGNLASRVISMVSRYRGGVVPNGPSDGLAEDGRSTLAAYREAMDRLLVHDALGTAMDFARTANGYVESREPWAQAKVEDDAEALDETLASLIQALVLLASLFVPVAPAKMSELGRRLGLSSIPSLDEALSFEVAGLNVETGDPLFPRHQQKG